jgi:hypothetical protein
MVAGGAGRPRGLFAVTALVLAAAVASPAYCAAARGPTASEWTALSRLPDWSGTWVPNVTDQFEQRASNRPSWTPKVAEQVAVLDNELKAGRPVLLVKGCLPLGMPSLMLITHNALEFLFTPGRVTILGESDGNRLRRIYTDGRGHPADPDLTFHGHSIGRWEGDTLVVDTVGIIPEAWLAIDEAIGAPSNGDMHIVERIHLTDPNTMNVDLEITAPKILTKPWKTTRIFHRQRGERYEIIEGECVQGNFKSATDKDGNAVFERVPESEDGSVVPRTQ